jgi:hypothetical protein
MKYIKTFEHHIDWYYYRVSTNPSKLRLSLKKIGMPDYKIEEWITKKYGSACDFVNIYIRGNDSGDKTFMWASKNHIDNDYKYMGEIKVEDYEIEAEKYNL